MATEKFRRLNLEEDHGNWKRALVTNVNSKSVGSRNPIFDAKRYTMFNSSTLKNECKISKSELIIRYI